MMTKQFGYYNLDSAVKLLSDGNLIATGTTASALEVSLKAFFDEAIRTSNETGQAIFKQLSFLAKNNVFSSVGVEALEVIFNGEEFSVGDVVVSAIGGTVSSAAVGFSIATALGVSVTAPVVLLGAAVGGSLIWAATGIDFNFVNPNDNVDLQFFDDNGEHVSGIYYPQGLDDTSQAHENAVRYFISQAGAEITQGGELRFIENGFDDEWTIYHANLIVDKIVELSAAANVTEWLNLGNKKNLDAHVIKGSDHYLIFEENAIALDVSVAVGGATQVITVENIYHTSVTTSNILLGKEEGGINLVLGANSYAQNLLGSDDADVLISGAENDTLNGGDGNDTIIGGSGNDSIIGSVGNDAMDGGDGVDVLNYTTLGTVVTVNLNNHMVSFSGGNQTVYNIEKVIGSAYNDTMIGSGAFDQLEGGAGNDSIDGYAGDDIIDGDSGNDILLGGVGNDLLIGGEDHDILDGGFDQDVLVGGNGNDSLLGGEHRDLLQGGSGEDALYGGSYGDALLGESNNDTLDGDAGFDYYLFSSSFSDGNDVILDDDGALFVGSRNLGGNKLLAANDNGCMMLVKVA